MFIAIRCLLVSYKTLVPYLVYARAAGSASGCRRSSECPCFCTGRRALRATTGAPCLRSEPASTRASPSGSGRRAGRPTSDPPSSCPRGEPPSPASGSSSSPTTSTSSAPRSRRTGRIRAERARGAAALDVPKHKHGKHKWITMDGKIN